MRRKLVFVGVALVLVLTFLGAGLLFHVSARHDPQRAFKSIREGMSKAEVEAAIGLPVGDYRTDKSPIEFEPDYEIWAFDNCRIGVVFRDGKASFLYMRRPEGLSLYDYLRQWLGF